MTTFGFIQEFKGCVTFKNINQYKPPHKLITIIHDINRKE